MAKVIIRPTIPADLSSVIGEPLPYRIRALTAVLQDGEAQTILGVGGLAFPPSGPPWAFVQQSVDAKRYPLSFHRAGRMAMEMIRESGVREVAATCDLDNPAAGRWLSRLGFVLGERQDMPNKLVWFWTRRD